MTILSSLLLDGSPLNSSTDTLQLSSDGQIAIAMRGAIYLIAPELRAVGSGTSNEEADSLTWTQTSIQDLGKTRLWCESSTHWRAISLGSLEVVWQAIAWSPSGLNKLGGCLLVTLTNNLQVSIWTPVKNPQTGEWVRLQDVTEDQMSLFDESSISTENILRCQTCSIAWSPPVWGHSLVLPTSTTNSLLAMGSRSGDVNFFSWDSSKNTVQPCLTHNVASAWVIKLTWCSWKVNSTEGATQTAQTYLACSLSDGSVWILTVKYDPSSEDPYSILDCSLIMSADSRPVAAMTFVEIGPEHQPLLAYAKPGFVCLHKLTVLSEDQMVEDDVVRTIMLSPPRTSLASTFLATCTGLYYVRSGDCLIVSLAEGSLSVIAEVSGAAHLQQESDSPDQPSTIRLSKQMRRLNEVAEERPLELAEYTRIHGFQHIGTSNYAIWAQELLQPYDLSFRIQATYKTRICLARLWEPDQDTTTRIVGSVRAALLTDHNAISYYSPTVLYRDAMFELLDPAVFISAAPRLLPMLAPDWNPPSMGRPAEIIAALPQKKVSDVSFAHLTRLKLGLVSFLIRRACMPTDLVQRFQSLHTALLETAVALHIQSTVNRIFAANDASLLAPRAGLVGHTRGARAS
ncbi:hypothetical protein BDV93DRAFT_543140 [Ceratobasidium sp. AG-I]|nr:hypothetical protein BDV93DRAFT_543140 [Ceratobasidium sp. AG-I]